MQSLYSFLMYRPRQSFNSSQGSWLATIPRSPRALETNPKRGYKSNRALFRYGKNWPEGHGFESKQTCDWHWHPLLTWERWNCVCYCWDSSPGQEGLTSSELYAKSKISFEAEKLSFTKKFFLRFRCNNVFWWLRAILTYSFNFILFSLSLSLSLKDSFPFSPTRTLIL